MIRGSSVDNKRKPYKGARIDTVGAVLTLIRCQCIRIFSKQGTVIISQVQTFILWSVVLVMPSACSTPAERIANQDPEGDWPEGFEA